MRPAAFIDRDGTLIEEVNFLSRAEDLSIFTYTREALASLRSAGFFVVVVTNQSGIGRGIYTEADMHSIHRAMDEELEGLIDRYYFCPHLPDEGCRCRKPGLGMLEAAQADLAIDLRGSWMIGDKTLDIETGKNAGIQTALVKTGYGSSHLSILNTKPNVVAADLLEAVRQIVRPDLRIVR